MSIAQAINESYRNQRMVVIPLMIGLKMKLTIRLRRWERLIFRHGWAPDVRHNAIVITGIGTRQRKVAGDMCVDDLT